MEGYFFAKLAYEAYWEAMYPQEFASIRCPDFHLLSERQKKAWQKAADAVLSGTRPPE